MHYSYIITLMLASIIFAYLCFYVEYNEYAIKSGAERDELDDKKIS